MVQDPVRHTGIEEGFRGVNAHSAGIRSGIAIADPLVILRGKERGDMLTVGKAEEADLFAFKELFNDDLPFCFAQQGAAEKTLGGFDGSTARLADEHAFAGGETVGFDNDGRMKDFDRAFQLLGSGAHRVVGGGDVVALKKPLGKSLARFEHGCRTSRTENAYAEIVQCVDDAQRQRQFGADDREARLLFNSYANQGFKIFEVNRNAASYFGNAAIAGRADDLGDPLTALNRPGQRMLAASRTKDQDFHRCFPALVLWMTHWNAERLSEQTGSGKSNGCGLRSDAFSYTGAWQANLLSGDSPHLVDRIIKPYLEEHAARDADERYKRAPSAAIRRLDW